jgi:hypothetical protein
MISTREIAEMKTSSPFRSAVSMAGSCDVFIADLDAEIGLEAQEAAPGLVLGSVLQACDESEHFLLPLGRQFAKYFEFPFCDCHASFNQPLLIILCVTSVS